MKKMKTALVIAIVAVAFLHIFANAQKYDSTSLAKIFNSKSYMDSWNKEMSLYLLKPKSQENTLILYKNITMDSVLWKKTTSAKIKKSQSEFLEIRELEEASYLFYKGNEIRKLIPEISQNDYFENKIVNDEEMIFKFKDGTYGWYNYIKNLFYRTKK
ncbi:MAG: hypothetical protein WCG45_03730 [bacterium]